MWPRVVGAWGEMQWIFQCRGCGKESQGKIQRIPLRIDGEAAMELLRPIFPKGWHLVDGIVYCEQHVPFIQDQGITAGACACSGCPHEANCRCRCEVCKEEQ